MLLSLDILPVSNVARSPSRTSSFTNIFFCFLIEFRLLNVFCHALFPFFYFLFLSLTVCRPCNENWIHTIHTHAHAHTTSSLFWVLKNSLAMLENCFWWFFFKLFCAKFSTPFRFSGTTDFHQVEKVKKKTKSECNSHGNGAHNTNSNWIYMFQSPISCFSHFNIFPCRFTLFSLVCVRSLAEIVYRSRQITYITNTHHAECEQGERESEK